MSFCQMGLLAYIYHACPFYNHELLNMLSLCVESALGKPLLVFQDVSQILSPLKSFGSVSTSTLCAGLFFA